MTATAPDEKEAKKLVKPMVKELKGRFGNHVYTTDSEVTLEKAVVDLLMANKLTSRRRRWPMFIWPWIMTWMYFR